MIAGQYPLSVHRTRGWHGFTVKRRKKVRPLRVIGVQKAATSDVEKTIVVFSKKLDSPLILSRGLHVKKAKRVNSAKRSENSRFRLIHAVLHSKDPGS